ncbi:MAG TPA: hypothetical protein VIM88_09825 [Sulfurovum sp.]
MVVTKAVAYLANFSDKVSMIASSIVHGTKNFTKFHRVILNRIAMTKARTTYEAFAFTVYIDLNFGLAVC